jgi:2-oxoglutarate ferredoxin oxidoreductase subunit alpha
MMEGVWLPLMHSLGQDKPWAVGGGPHGPRNLIRSLFLEEGVLEAHNERLQEKFRAMRGEVRSELIGERPAEVLLVAYGSMARVCRQAARELADVGIRTLLFRPVTVWPFDTEALWQTARTVDAVFVVEMSEGQMVEDVRLAVQGRRPIGFFGRLGGGVPTPGEVVARVKDFVTNKLVSELSEG